MQGNKILALFMIVAFATTFLTGCADDPALSPEPLDSLESKLTAVENSDVTIVEGQIGPGSLYAIYVPADWNGDLVLYAHGYTYPQLPVHLPTNVGPFRDALVEEGFAVAYSSYPENGFSVKEGTIATRQLRGIFKSHFEKPDHTYLAGVSMGSLVSVMLAERNPNLFDGVLAMCGIVGGSTMTIEHIFTVRVLFDYFYPEVLPGTVFEIPEGVDLNAALGEALGAILANPLGVMQIGAISQCDLAYADANELIEGVLTVLGFQLAGANDLVDRAHGHPFFDNSDVVYTGSFDDVALNAGVERCDTTNDAVAFLRNVYEPSGLLKIPILMLHTTRDPVATIDQCVAYADVVALRGAEAMLQDQFLDRFGHCTFTAQEQKDAFLYLTAWVETLEPAVAQH